MRDLDEADQLDSPESSNQRIARVCRCFKLHIVRTQQAETFLKQCSVFLSPSQRCRAFPSQVQTCRHFL